MTMDILKLFISPVAKIFEKREERRMTKTKVKGKLQEARETNATQITFNDQELEQLLVSQKESSWVDEYVTVSNMSILNIIVVGGIMAAFGEVRVLEGMGLAVNALVSAGVDVGFIITATVLAGLGLNVWRKA